MDRREQKLSIQAESNKRAFEQLIAASIEAGESIRVFGETLSSRKPRPFVIQEQI